MGRREVLKTLCQKRGGSNPSTPTIFIFNTVDAASDMKLNDIAKYLALVLTLAGALATSLALDPLNIILLNFGSLLYLYWSCTVKDWNLIAVNGGILIIYIAGALLRL